MLHTPAQATWFDIKQINLQSVNYDYSINKTGYKINFINKSS